MGMLKTYKRTHRKMQEGGLWEVRLWTGVILHMSKLEAHEVLTHYFGLVKSMRECLVETQSDDEVTYRLAIG